jgi:hypothetical protein
MKKLLFGILLFIGINCQAQYSLVSSGSVIEMDQKNNKNFTIVKESIKDIFNKIDSLIDRVNALEYEVRKLKNENLVIPPEIIPLSIVENSTILDTVYCINLWSKDTISAYTESVPNYDYNKYFKGWPTKRETYHDPFKGMSAETKGYILTNYNQDELKYMLSPITWRDKYKK